MLSRSGSKWYFVRRLTIALVGLLVLGVLALQAFAAFPAGTTSSIPAGIPAQNGGYGGSGVGNPSKDDPYGIASFNCADIATYKVDKQMNARADAQFYWNWAAQDGRHTICKKAARGCSTAGAPDHLTLCATANGSCVGVPKRHPAIRKTTRMINSGSMGWR